MNNVQWHKIEGGFRGFEKLACLYVKMEFPNAGEWKHTQETRDGNKDAYTILLGYQPYELSDEQWWMEAKYSQKKEYLSRYRMDATVVSAIISRNVTKIIFVTNILVNTKTVVDIKRALEKAIGCKDVYFCTRYMLEYWLIQNPSVFQEFFPDEFPQLESLRPFVLEEIEFYQSSRKYLSFSEPQRVLYTNRQYTAYFTIFSPISDSLNVIFSKAYKEFLLIGDNIIDIKKGVQPITIDFLVPDNIDNISNITGTFLSLSNGLEIAPKYAIELLIERNRFILIGSQEKIYMNLKQEICNFQLKHCFNMICVSGDSGTGKTFIVDRFFKKHIISYQNVFWGSFTSNSISNDELLLNILLFILFPYVIPEMIDYDYIQEIKTPFFIPTIIKKLVKSRNLPEELRLNFKESAKKADYLPARIELNTRYIILDDVQFLDSLEKDILFKICQECVNKETPIFLVVIGHPYFYSDDVFRNLQRNVFPRILDCSLSSEEIINVLNSVCQFNTKTVLFNYQMAFPTLIELFLFVQYVEDSTKIIYTFHQFDFLYQSFKKNKLMDKYIVARFNDAFNADSSCKDICIAIYRSINGLLIDKALLSNKQADGLRFLLKLNLIKFDDNRKLIPYHDIYKKIFRKYFKEGSDFKGLEADKHLEQLHNILVTSLNRNDLENAYYTLLTLLEKQKYYSLLYVLEEIFDVYSIHELQCRYGRPLFSKIYYIYSMSITNASDLISGNQIFKKVYEVTMNSRDIDIQKIHLKTAWELCNSSFEHLDYQTALEYIQEIKETANYLSIIANDFNNSCPIELYCSQTIETLMMSEFCQKGSMMRFILLKKEMFKSEFVQEGYSFVIRYLETLYVRNGEKAFTLLKHYYSEIIAMFQKDSKLFFWASFDYHLLKVILEQQLTSIKEMESLLETAHENYLNDWRKRKIILGCLYYKHGFITQGNSCIFSDLSISRKTRPRYRAFYYSALALAKALDNNFREALIYLDKAFDIFSFLPSYADIISHNYNVISSNRFKKNKIDFATDISLMNDDVFYIDPRSGW